VKKRPKKRKKADLARLSGVGKKSQEALSVAGFTTLEDIARAQVSGLTKVKGIGKKKAEKIIAQAKELKAEKNK
jgi:transcription termination factor NusA